MFVHLHNHSHYSILEGLPKPKDYIKKAKEFGMNAVAITDTGNVYGCHEFYKEAKSQGINPILGTEMFIEGVLDKNIDHKIVLLAKSLNGYRNILNIVSKANLDNPGKKAKILWKDLENIKNEKGDLEIICLSGPISGEIPYFVLAGKNDDQIIKRINEYIDIFGKDSYYLELLYHDDIPKQNFVTDKLIDLSNKYEINIVACNNCYYIEEEDKKTQDIIMALGTGHELENPDRPTMINGDYSFLNEKSMNKLFGFIPKALENTQKIADMVNIEIDMGGVLIPSYVLPEEDKKIYIEAIENEKELYKRTIIKKLTSDEWYLRYLSFVGLNKRYNSNLSKEIIFKLIQKLNKPGLNKKLTESTPDELKDLSITYYSEEKKEIINSFSQELKEKIERLEYELQVVHEMGFDAYFLIVADYINWAKQNDIPVGPGRGSAAGSLMAFLTGITDIDPLPYKLLFERFLNPARISMPDIDTDFSDTERDRVVDYCRKKYGDDKVAQICTFGTFAARAAVKDVGRTFGVPFGEMNELAKLIPEKPGTKLLNALEESIEFKEAYENNKKYKDIIDNALKIEGNVRQLGVHACAVIIAPQSMTNFTALQHPPKDSNTIVTQYSAYPLEDLGLLKMDFLGLRNLTIIKRAQKIIKRTKGVDIDILKINLDDQKVFNIFALGDTTGIFQFESDGMRKYLKDLGPDKFEDLIAMVSLYRPGPISYIPKYIDVKYGREEKKYMTDELRKILKEAGYSNKVIEEEKRKLDEDLSQILDVSYGIAVYQEQLLFIVQYMAGFSLGEADLLRRGIGKKIHEVIEKLRLEFIEKGKSYRNYKPETTKYIYMEMIMPAANYSFNKSHAACYALIAYQTAYLKAYFKTEFMTSVMVSDEDSMDRVVLEVGECQNLGISVLPPSVNESLKHFTYIDDKNIRFGLRAIKGIGDGPINKIIEAREKAGGKFNNLEEFIELTGKEVINKKTLEALIKSGAMDKLGVRKQMYSSIDEIIKFCRRNENKKATSQIGLFDNSNIFEEKLELIQCEEFSFEEKLIGENEMIGFSVSGHPLDSLKKYCARRSQNTKKLKLSFEELSNLDSIKKGEKIQAIGVIVDIRKITTKNGNSMIFLKCEGFDYNFEVIIFPKDVDTYKDKINLNKIIIVNGFLDINLEYKRKSIKSKDIQILGINQVREQAKDLGLFDNSKRLMNIIEISENKKDFINEIDNGEKKEVEFENELNEKINLNKIEKEEKINNTNNIFTINIPIIAIKEDLVDLKKYLLQEKKGNIKIMIELKGNIKDTNIYIEDTNGLIKWIKEKWT